MLCVERERNDLALQTTAQICVFFSFINVYFPPFPGVQKLYIAHVF